MNQLLDAREKRIAMINKRIKSSLNPLLLIKANIPGSNKHLKEAYLLIAIFLDIVKTMFSISKTAYLMDDDGPFVLCDLQSKDAVSLKTSLIHLEETHPLGRLIDLDLFYLQESSLSRQALNLPPRPCMICGHDAYLCMRQQSHTHEELITHIKTNTYQFLKRDIESIIKSAMLKELDLEHKFGLVTPTSQGSHPDMDYHMMRKAMDAILPFITEMFDLSQTIDDLGELFGRAQLLGILAEKKMLEETDGINCYKGLIFILGLGLIAFGHVLHVGKIKTDIPHAIKAMTKHLNDHWMHAHTFGVQAYRDYGITGARGEAMHGLPHVFLAMDIIENSDESPASLRDVLAKTASSIDDTVLLKRSQSITFYQSVKKRFQTTDAKDLQQAKTLTSFCIDNGLSIGGSADILVTALVLRKLVSRYLIDSFDRYE